MSEAARRRTSLLPSFTLDQLYARARRTEEHLYRDIQKGDRAAKQAFSHIFLMYLAILDKCPEDEQALARLYRVATLFTCSHQRLEVIMNRVRAHYEVQLRINPNDSQACVRIYQIEVILNNASGAIPWADKALRLNPENPDAHLAVAHEWLARGDRQAARAATDRAIALNANSADAYAFSALLIGDEDIVRMIAEYRKCFDIDPSHLEAMTVLQRLSSEPKPAATHVKLNEVVAKLRRKLEFISGIGRRLRP